MRNGSENTVCLSVHLVLSYTFHTEIFQKPFAFICFFYSEPLLVSSVGHAYGVREVIPTAANVRVLLGS